MKICLIRHGKPIAAINPKLSASGFATWVRHYNQSNIASYSLPPPEFKQSFTSSFIVTSDLPRAIDSAYVCLNKQPDLILKEVREMEIPRYKLPFTLHAYTWLIFNRILWFLGFSGRVESFKCAKTRARNIARELHQLAIKHNNVVVFGHGLMNRYIAKELHKLGGDHKRKGKGYWSMIELTFDR